MDAGNEYKCFVKENFRQLKIRDAQNIRIGRRTHDWLLSQEHRTHLSHLTLGELDRLSGKWGMKMVPFDDGFTYVVNPAQERDVMVAFYARKEEEDATDAQIAEALPLPENDLLESYRISEAAIELLTGDSMEDLDLSPDSVVDFLDNDVIEQGLAQETVHIFVDEGRYTVIASVEETPDGEVYPLHIQHALPGTEVPLTRLDLKRRTQITGQYRDQVENSSHDFEHNITRMDDR